MSPTFSMKQLSDLQDVDSQILAREKILSNIKIKLADNSAVQKAEQTLQTVEGQLSGQSSIRRGIESEIQQITEKIQTVDDRLYGGSVTNPRELSAYQEERAMLQRQLAVEEEKMLELMVQIEDLQNSRNTAREAHTQLSEQRERDVQDWEHTSQQLSSEIGELNQSRAVIAEGIPATTLSTYASLLRTRGGQAVAKVERGICMGCRITLPRNTVQRARSSSGPVQCTSCRRLLYVV